MAPTHAIGLVGIEAGVDAEDTAIGIRRAEGRDVVGERPLLAQLEEEPAAHPVAEQRAEQLERPAIRMVPGDAGHPQAQVALRQLTPRHPHRSRPRRSRRPNDRPGGDPGEPVARSRIGKPRFGDVEDRPMGRVAGDGQHEMLRAVPAAPVAEHLLVRRAPHRTRRAGDLAAQWVVAEQHLVEEGEDVVARGVDVHPDLVDDDRLLGHEVRVPQQRAQDELRDHVERAADGLGRGLRRVDRQLAVGGGVQRPAAALDRLREASRDRGGRASP